MATTGLTAKRSSSLQIQGLGCGRTAASCEGKLKVANNGLRARQVFHWDRRPVRAPGQSAAAGLRASPAERRRSHSGLEQVEPRTHHHRLRALVRAASGRCRRQGARIGSSHTFAMPTTSPLQTVDRFLEPCDFYTIDVADFIGQPADTSQHRQLCEAPSRTAAAASNSKRWTRPSRSRKSTLSQTAQKFLAAVKKAGEVYRKIEKRQGRGQLHPRSLHGRNRPRAEPRGAAHHPGGHRRRRHSRPDHRAKIQRPLQQGRRLRRRRRAVRARDGARRCRHRLRSQAIWPA